ncbi:hypothetical protein EDB81DRAFT_411021 [Dactylonectria macrodidyma]|uniref:Uncharacterized protein n=1 Tax=Dactylonectria macrodidyma TaxID=307937 RepID=A0A9P9FA82_9HYPO|nr:hypothetical protein EDB81DRAFT_411021 [Dactylonectria macrodidyma]
MDDGDGPSPHCGPSLSTVVVVPSKFPPPKERRQEVRHDIHGIGWHGSSMPLAYLQIKRGSAGTWADEASKVSRGSTPRVPFDELHSCWGAKADGRVRISQSFGTVALVSCGGGISESDSISSKHPESKHPNIQAAGETPRWEQQDGMDQEIGIAVTSRGPVAFSGLSYRPRTLHSHPIQLRRSSKRVQRPPQASRITRDRPSGSRGGNMQKGDLRAHQPPALI